jgi:hypothetical protein
MDPVTIVLAVAGIAIGFGANTVVTKRIVGSAQDQADKEEPHGELFVAETGRSVAEAIGP